MSRRNAKPCTHRNPNVRGNIEVFADGSGAPAALHYNGFTFAFDFLGELKVNLVGGKGTRVQSRIAKEVCEREYRLLMADHGAGDAWLALNAAMYEVG